MASREIILLNVKFEMMLTLKKAII